ncbi:hypothetical protein SADUNF_Sadunf15G0085900 [Salix dunnii]|uniref:Uncharacterized protein n=1 Tax=Salix dunnii TaxID=1413687 RepID=A0A835JBB6_9ROSI|nr:hypothetical protein SADUNF_Sadunf15G0085900 [Salix dunnii]
MADWGPVIVAVVLFVLLTPGLLFQMPGGNRVVEFGNMQTSGASIVVHAVYRASVIVGVALRVFVFNNLVFNLWVLFRLSIQNALYLFCDRPGMISASGIDFYLFHAETWK